MQWFALYLIIGLIAILANERRLEKKGIRSSGVFLMDYWVFPFGILFWPVVIIFSNADAKAQEFDQEMKRLRMNEEIKCAPEDLTALLGKPAVAVTPLMPNGMVKIDDKRYPAVSEGGVYLESQSILTVTGITAFRELKVSLKQ